VPPYLTYAYVPESPALIEGSIYRNLILGVDPDKKEQPTTEQVRSAHELSLTNSAALITAPHSFVCACRCGRLRSGAAFRLSFSERPNPSTWGKGGEILRCDRGRRSV
jgi:hypothetical protein